jgi:Fe2+ or Zn2+ uptake regulation protein
MDAFEDSNIVHKLKGQSKYMICEHPCDDHCHHQFICDSCGDVSDLHISDESFIGELIKKFPGIKIEAHYFEFSGLCKNCN